MAVQWPHVKAWLVATVPNLPGLSDVRVFDGQPVTGEIPERYVTVGFVSLTDDTAGSFQQSIAYDGSVLTEIGEIRTEMVAQTGDGDLSVSLGRAFQIADALDAVIRADRTLGGTLSPDGTAETSTEVLSISNANGTATALVHTLRYTTTT